MVTLLAIPNVGSPTAEASPAAFLQQPESTPTTLGQLQRNSKRVQQQFAFASESVVAFEGGSGVIVSPDGWALTAAHVSQTPGRRIKVHLANGLQWMAETHGIHRQSDAGIVKLLGDHRWPFLKIAVDDPPQVGQWCLALGYAWNRRPAGVAAVRLGRLRQVDSQQMVSDIPIIGGDSGGPLLNMDGRIIAIHSRIRQNIDHNVHIPVKQFLKHWPKLTLGTIIGNNKTGPLKNTNDTSQRSQDSRNSASVQSALADLMARHRSSIAEISRRPTAAGGDDSSTDLPPPSVLGTIVSASGLVVAKHSHLLVPPTDAVKPAPPEFSCQIDGSQYAAQLIAKNIAMDLALLELQTEAAPSFLPIIVAAPSPSAPPQSIVNVGQTLIALTMDTNMENYRASLGTLMAPAQEFQSITDRQGLDLGVIQDPGAGLFAASVFPGSLAQQSGIKAGDRITGVAGRPVTTWQQLQQELTRLSRSEQTQLNIIRANHPRTLEVNFPKRRPVIWDRWAGGPFSQRRFDFGDVLAHDAIVAPNDCGGPVLDLQGNTVGVNVSRAIRNTTFAIPIDRIIDWVSLQRPKVKLGRDRK